MTSPDRLRGGFTLKELLASVTVIAVLLALLPPLLNQSRTPGLGNTCRNNLRNLGLSMLYYETDQGRYPGYNNELSSPRQYDGSSQARSWTFVLLPYMDNQAYYEQFRDQAIPNSFNAQGAEHPHGIQLELEIAICPSDAFKDSSIGTYRSPRLAPTSYTVNTGQLDASATAEYPADFLENGVFHRGVRAWPDDLIVSNNARYIAAADGLGTTLMISENLDARSWTDTQERWTGFTYHLSDGVAGKNMPNPPHPLAINVRKGHSRTSPLQDSSAGYARPSSNHPGGANMEFCDGHVRFISDQISYGVYQALMTPNGPKARDNSTPQGTPLPAGHAATRPVDEAEIR